MKQIRHNVQGWIQQLTNTSGATQSSTHPNVSGTIRSSTEIAHENAQKLWWRWRYLFLEAKKLDLALRREDPEQQL